MLQQLTEQSNIVIILTTVVDYFESETCVEELY